MAKITAPLIKSICKQAERAGGFCEARGPAGTGTDVSGQVVGPIGFPSSFEVAREHAAAVPCPVLSVRLPYVATGIRVRRPGFPSSVYYTCGRGGPSTLSQARFSTVAF